MFIQEEKPAVAAAGSVWERVLEVFPRISNI